MKRLLLGMLMIISMLVESTTAQEIEIISVSENETEYYKSEYIKYAYASENTILIFEYDIRLYPNHSGKCIKLICNKFSKTNCSISKDSIAKIMTNPWELDVEDCKLPISINGDVPNTRMQRIFIIDELCDYVEIPEGKFLYGSTSILNNNKQGMEIKKQTLEFMKDSYPDAYPWTAKLSSKDDKFFTVYCKIAWILMNW